MLVQNKLLTLVALAVTLAVGAGGAEQSGGQPAAVPAQGGAQVAPWGFDLTGIDQKAKPGDSFFDYANGAWDARTEIPADKTSYGAFVALRDKSEEQVQAIINDAAKSGASPTTDIGKIGAISNAF